MGLPPGNQMPIISQRLGADSNIDWLLRFATARIDVVGIGKAKQHEVRLWVHQFLFGMIRLAELPPRKLRLDQLHSGDRYWRRFLNASGPIWMLRKIAADNLLTHEKLAHLASQEAATETYLLHEIVRTGNRKSVGVCRSCGQYWIRESAVKSRLRDSLSWPQVEGYSETIHDSFIRPPTHSGVCYDQYYTRTLRTGADAADRKRSSRTAQGELAMGAARKKIRRSGRHNQDILEMLDKGVINLGDVPSMLSRRKGFGRTAEKYSPKTNVFVEWEPASIIDTDSET